MSNSVDAVNYRGRSLIDFMMRHNLSLINESIDSDGPANITFSGARGNSVMDLDFCINPFLAAIHRLSVLNRVTCSDHFPVLIFNQY